MTNNEGVHCTKTQSKPTVTTVTEQPPYPALNTPEVGWILSMTRENAYKKIMRGELPVVRLSPRKWEVTYTDLLAYITANKLSPVRLEEWKTAVDENRLDQWRDQTKDAQETRPRRRYRKRKKIIAATP